MSKKVLALYYTQSGQLEEIMDSFTAPMIDAGMQVEKVLIHPEKPFDFPWTSETFFNEMPESVLGIPVKLRPFTLKETAYDLIILGYQPWFLSPSIPTTSLFTDSQFQDVIKNTPVVTVIGARNMWLSSQEKLKKKIDIAGGKRVGNIALVDRNNNSMSAVSILYWMLTGKKEKYLGIFPKPGVSDQDIANAKVFGNTVMQHLQRNDYHTLQRELVAQKAVEVKPNLMFIESKATKLFGLWAKLIIGKKNRKPWVTLFKYYLLVALFIIAPIVVGINGILFRPFFRKQVERKKKYYLELN